MLFARLRMLATMLAALALLTACGAEQADTTASVTSLEGVEHATPIGLADDPPASLAFVDESVAPSTGVLAAPAEVSVHSGPDARYTELGTIAPGEIIGLTGNRAVSEGERWNEIVWKDATGWIPEVTIG